MDHFIETYCACETSDKSKHIIENHSHEILSNTLQPVFKKQISLHPNLTKKPPSKYGSKSIDIHEDQQWKKDHYVQLLFWLLNDMPAKQLQDSMNFFVPPVLIILDDYDVEFKEQGVRMLQIMIHKLEPHYISKFGLDNVFLESLFKCLSYLSQDRDIPLLRATYPCILKLIAAKKQDKVKSDLFERVLKEGILIGFTYAGQKIQFQHILLRHISTLYEELGTIGVQYIKALIPTLCTSMSMTSSNNPVIKEINQLAAASLITIMKKCWPRIPMYKGLIMESLAKTWMYYFNAKDQAMCKILKQVYQVFEAACQGQEKADTKALIKYNPSVFEPLFCTVLSQ